jgi:nicotinate-nucleotide pyrophosphorylase (carboxylating)
VTGDREPRRTQPGLTLQDQEEQHSDTDRLARWMLEEDGSVDITTQLAVPPEALGRGIVESREAGVLAGEAYADALARHVGCGPITWSGPDGLRLGPGATIATLDGPLTALLRAERPLLNVLQRASGIATLTRRFVDAVAGTSCRILHTRKTAPGLREFDVRAVSAGGGQRHRLDLAHEIMIKDNHWQALSRGGRTLAQVLETARARGVRACYVEVESESQLHQACAAGATRILVDNQSPETLSAWGAAARRLSAEIEVEASGGITLENVRRYAEAGADYISVGALTHSTKALDLALRLL